MNARPGVVLVTGLVALALALVSWRCTRPGAADPDVMPSGMGAVAEAGWSVTSDQRDVIDGQGAAAQRVAGVDAGLRLRIRDAADLGPLSDARARWRAGDGEWHRAVAVADASVRLAANVGEQIDLEVECPGYCALRGRLTPDSDSLDVLLERAGEVECTVRGRSGEPVAGVEVMLLPPLEQGRWEAGWVELRRGDASWSVEPMQRTLRVERGVVVGDDAVEHIGGGRVIDLARLACTPLRRVSDAAGVVSWQGVPAADNYRFGVLGKLHAELSPAHESQRLRVTPAGVVVGVPPPDGLSGSFAVRGGDQSMVEARLVGSAAVRGELRCGEHAEVVVKLCRILQAGGGDVRPVTAVDAEILQRLDARRCFRFEDVRPGLFAVRACWMENAHDVYCVSTTLQLLPGMDLDLGELVPMSGEHVRVRAELRCADDPCLAEQVFLEPRQAVTSLAFSFLPDSQSLADAVTEAAIIPFDREFVLHGVPPGRLQVQATPIDGQGTRAWVQRLDAGDRIDELVSRLGGSVVVAVQVRGGVTVSLRVSDRIGRDVPLGELHAVELDSGHVQSLAISADESGGRVIRIARGRHLLSASLMVDGEWLSGICSCDIGEDPVDLHLEMLPAARVRGRYVGLRNAEAGERALRWSPKPFAERGVWLFSCNCEVDGEFSLEGIPAGVELVGEGRLPALRPVAEGDLIDLGAIGER